MLVCIVAGVIFRYFLNAPLSWTDEMAIYSLVWVTFIGGSMGIKRQQAAAVTLLMDRFSGKARRVLLSLGFAVITGFCLYLFFLSVTWISAPTMLLQKSQSMDLPMFYPYLCIPIGLGCMSIHSLDLLLRTLLADEGEGM
jgi:TRAP-type C4-dicarboxylate transport system permease small subunit